MSTHPEGQNASPDISSGAKNARTAIWAGSIAVVMLGASYAAVPLYQIFCQVTGFGGTTQVADAPSGKVIDRVVTVRFDSNVSGGLGWNFKPVKRTMQVKLGENALAFYRATNTSNRTLVGTASFNVAPYAAGSYFSKIECFCFTEQVLKPGESVDMPVSFFVDSEFATDKDTVRLSEITLSYTFYPVDNPKTQVARDEVRAPAEPQPAADGLRDTPNTKSKLPTQG
ncbi:MAG: cytochrome c oxidase assembly protein [Pseudomonadota bacterium]